MKNNLDQILQHVLVPLDEPDDCLNRNIIDSVKKMQTEEMEVAMRKSWYKRVPVTVMAAAIIVLLGGFSVRAAWKYLKPEQVAEKNEDKKLAEAFRGEDSVSINETQSYGGYTVTLLGTTSGKNLSSYTDESDDEVKEDRTYAVVAIEKEDGTKMSESDQMSDLPEEEYDFLVSPLIKGADPKVVNIYCMNGGSSTFLEGGVMYRLVDCDNLEAFAEHGVYLSVNQSALFASEGYHFDKESGEITRNESYVGLNALFQLPLDSSKADEEAAQEQLRQWEKETGASDEEDEDRTEKEEKENDDWKPHYDWNPKTLEKYAEILPETVETLKADKDGCIHRKAWSYGGVSVKACTILVKGKDSYFEEEDFVGMSEYMGTLEDSDGKELIETYTRNEDGTITVAVYHEK